MCRGSGAPECPVSIPTTSRICCLPKSSSFNLTDILNLLTIYISVYISIKFSIHLYALHWNSQLYCSTAGLFISMPEWPGIYIISTKYSQLLKYFSRLFYQRRPYKGLICWSLSSLFLYKSQHILIAKIYVWETLVSLPSGKDKSIRAIYTWDDPFIMDLLVKYTILFWFPKSGLESFQSYRAGIQTSKRLLKLSSFGNQTNITDLTYNSCMSQSRFNRHIIQTKLEWQCIKNNHQWNCLCRWQDSCEYKIR